ncbi:MAG: iron donor protein CyaY [Burkholderiaceae bacterium]
MTETEFVAACERVLDELEDALDALTIDADTERTEQILTIELDDGSKIIVNGNTPLREIWVAARSGGFHFRHEDGRWLDTRSGRSLYACLSDCLSRQAGQAVELTERR